MLLDPEAQRTEERFLKKQDRLEKDFGWSTTVGPMAITTNYIETLALEVPKYLIASNNQEKDFIKLVKDLPIDTLALCVLNGGLQVIGSTHRGLSGALNRMGRDIEGECFSHGLKTFDEKLSIRLDKLARARHGNLKYRRQAVRTIAKKNGYVCEAWTNRQRIIAGNWALNLLIGVLPQVFALVVVDGHGAKELGLTEDAFDLANEAIKQAIYADPVWLPQTDIPMDWTDWERPTRVLKLVHRATLIRSKYAETAPIVRQAIDSGTMQPALDALNAIQAVPYTINTRVLEVIKHLHANGIDVDGLPKSKDLELPVRSKPWDQMSPDEQKAWKIRASNIKLRNRGLKSERVLLLQDLNTAEYLSQHKSFYTQCNFDWRGRVYPLPHFNFQREDRVRSLFLFANGQPMTEDGMYWLRVHIANCGDFDKVSKKSFAERVQWVLDNEMAIIDYALTPMEKRGWMEADKPFMFLAACMEYTSATYVPNYVTRLPISLDGSCSGLQHLSAMTLAKEGSLVNLTPCERPQDIYSVVAEGVTKSLEATLIDPSSSETERELSRLSLNYGITRSLVKRPTMTYGYSSQKYGMGSQLMEDLMRPLALEVLAGERDSHPFGEDGGFTASRFLADRIFNTIEQVVHKPAEAMDFLRHLAKAMAHENKSVVWTTPVGIPWVNRYHENDMDTINLWLYDKGIKKRHAINGYVTQSLGTKQVHKTKAANSVSPNVVHALDASHLMMTVNDLKEVSNVTDVALVHDSFGVHAPNVAILAGALRRQFVRLYTEFDPLQDILRTNEALILDWGRLPKLPTKGPLDIKEVLNAEYAFS